MFCMGVSELTTVEILKEMAFTATETQRRALEDAISALSTEGDLISRQAVDDFMYDYSRYHDLYYAQIMERINKIPSVENKGEWIDDVKSEIDKAQEPYITNTAYDEGVRFGLMLAYQIVDRCKAESEDKE